MTKTKTEEYLFLYKKGKGKTIREIADQFGVAYATVYDMIHKAIDPEYAARRSRSPRTARQTVKDRRTAPARRKPGPKQPKAVKAAPVRQRKRA